MTRIKSKFKKYIYLFIQFNYSNESLMIILKSQVDCNYCINYMNLISAADL